MVMKVGAQEIYIYMEVLYQQLEENMLPVLAAAVPKTRKRERDVVDMWKLMEDM